MPHPSDSPLSSASSGATSPGTPSSGTSPYFPIGRSRRRFLHLVAGMAMGTAVTGCGWRLGNVSTRATGPAVRRELFVYTWSNYTDQDLTDAFTAKTGIKVIVDTFDSNETMIAQLQAGKGANYSIIYPSDFTVSQMVTQKLVRELDHEQLIGISNLKERFQNSINDPGNRYSIPVSWGTTGLIYNSEKITDPPTDWNYLWDHKEKFAKRMTLLADMREVMGAVLRSLGYSYNSTNPQDIQKAYEKLFQLKPFIAAFNTETWRDQLLAGDLWIAMGYSADAANVAQQDAKFKYVIPQSGTSIWGDTMVIPQNAPNPNAAYEWMNFLLNPAVAAQVTERLFFATPNQAAYDQLPAALHGNTVLFPPDELLAKSETLTPISRTASELYEKYWTQLTSS
jgi:spermidine/putrescine transport system substrate-binding protein